MAPFEYLNNYGVLEIFEYLNDFVYRELLIVPIWTYTRDFSVYSISNTYETRIFSNIQIRMKVIHIEELIRAVMCTHMLE